MNCSKAQEWILPYRQGTIPDYELEDFIDHIKSCSRCREDLEIYYIVDMAKGLDSDEEESYDLVKLLNKDLDRRLAKMKKRRFFHDLVWILVMIFVLVMMGFLMRFLPAVFNS